MREQLIQYVELLFAGAPNSTEIKQEILQNTLDRYDDLVSQGKTPEAAYRLAISGIGDINEIINSEPEYHAPVYEAPVHNAEVEDPALKQQKKLQRAVAVAFYILCPMPLIILSEMNEPTVGLFLMFVLIAAATFLIIMSSDGKKEEAREEPEYFSPKQQTRKAIGSIVSAITLACYLLVSFFTSAWYITWLVFPIAACVKRLIYACIDLKEACDNEN